MNFATSRHKASWLFDEDDLERRRRESLDRSVHKAGCSHDPITLEEQQILCRHYERMTAKVCALFRLPRKILAVALTFLKRVFVRHSVLEATQALGGHAESVMLTCVYLACKVENHYVSAEDLARGVRMGQDVRQVERAMLGCEMRVLRSLDFDLLVHTPFAALDGFCFDMEEWLEDPEPRGRAWTHVRAEALTTKLRRNALASVDALLFSDAPLLFAPGVLAFASLEVAAKTCEAEAILRDYAQSRGLPQRARDLGDGSHAPSGNGARNGAGGHGKLEEGGSATQAQGGATFNAVLQRVHALGHAGSRGAPDPAVLKGIDRKVKTFAGVASGASKAKTKATPLKRTAPMADEGTPTCAPEPGSAGAGDAKRRKSHGDRAE